MNALETAVDYLDRLAVTLLPQSPTGHIYGSHLGVTIHVTVGAMGTPEWGVNGQWSNTLEGAYYALEAAAAEHAEVAALEARLCELAGPGAWVRV